MALHYLLIIVDGDVKRDTKNNCIGGIWFAGIVVFGKEYAFSQAGVESTLPVSRINLSLTFKF